MRAAGCYCPGRDGSAETPVHGTGRIPSGDPWLAFGYLVSGVLLYGLVGWLLDRWLGTSFLVVVGILVGITLGMLHDLVALPGARSAATGPGHDDTRTTRRRRRSANDTGDTVSLIGTSQLGSESFTPPAPATSTCRRSGRTGRSSSSARHVPRRHQADAPGRARRRPRLRLPLPRRAQAGAWCRAGCSSPARRPTASSATPWAATSSAAEDFLRFVPYLVTVFFFILVEQPLRDASRSSSSRRCLALGHGLRPRAAELADLQLRRHQEARLRRLLQAPVGARRHHGPDPACCWCPLEFMSNILVRPVTLALRLFANMFAGHLLLILFALGGEYLVLHMAAPVRPGRHPRLAAVHRDRASSRS